MKTIEYTCDRCGKVLIRQQLGVGSMIPEYLYPVGRYEEWCVDCIDLIPLLLKKRPPSEVAIINHS